MDNHKMGTGTGAGTKMRAVVETGTGMGTGLRTGSGRAEERGRSARNGTRVVDAMWEMGETWMERGKRRQERIGSEDQSQVIYIIVRK